jgi:hypothetical protein
MNPEAFHISHGMETVLIAACSSAIGGIISYLLQRRNFTYQLKLKQEELKTDFMAESTVRHFLNHKSYTDRSFTTLKNYLGGFEDDELRKILVRGCSREWMSILTRKKTEIVDGPQTTVKSHWPIVHGT